MVFGLNILTAVIFSQALLALIHFRWLSTFPDSFSLQSAVIYRHGVCAFTHEILSTTGPCKVSAF